MACICHCVFRDRHQFLQVFWPTAVNLIFLVSFFSLYFQESRAFVLGFFLAFFAEAHRIHRRPLLSRTGRQKRGVNQRSLTITECDGAWRRTPSRLRLIVLVAHVLFFPNLIHTLIFLEVCGYKFDQ